MPSLRLFIAVFLPDPIRLHVGSHLNSTDPFPAFRFTHPESMHVTLKFLGQVPEFKVPEIRARLAALAARRGPFEIDLQGGGAFPSVRTARVFWVGLDGQVDLLKSMAEETEAAMQEVGFPSENRKFKPHLTLARPKSEGQLERDGARFCKLFSTYKSPMFRVNSIQLVESRLGSHGSRYEILDSFPLGRSS